MCLVMKELIDCVKVCKMVVKLSQKTRQLLLKKGIYYIYNNIHKFTA